MTEPKPETNAAVRALEPVNKPTRALTAPFVRSSHEELVKLATYLAKSTIIPKDFQGKPENCYIAMSMGEDVGLRGIQALQNIMVVNGRPSLWGDVVLAIAKTSPEVEWIHEDEPETVKKNEMARCEVKLRGVERTIVRTFSKADAILAGLWGKKSYDGKPTPWITYPYRMMAMRARAFAIRDAIPHALKGLSIIEEQQDVPEYLEKSMPKETIRMPERLAEPAQASGDAPAESAQQPATSDVAAQEPKKPTYEQIEEVLKTPNGEIYKTTAEDYGIGQRDLFSFIENRKRPLNEIIDGNADDLMTWIQGELG